MSLYRKKLHVISEAPTPHNNFLFQAIAQEPEIELRLYYMYTVRDVPERTWQSLSEHVGADYVKSGIRTRVDFDLLWKALFASAATDVFWIIGWSYPSMYWVILLLGLRKKPFMVWFDTPLPQERVGLGIRSLAKRLLIRLINRSRATVFLTGKHASVIYTRMGIQSELIRNLPFFVPQPALGPHYEARREESRLQLGVGHDTILFLAAGRLIRSKGYDLLLDAVSVVRAGGFFFPFKVVIVGSGPELKNLETQAADLGLSGVVEFVPWQEPSGLESYMQMSDVFVQPARFDPFPTVVIQAMAHCRIVIASDRVYSAVEFLTPGVNGLLFPSGNTGALADAMRLLIRNPQIIQTFGLAARRTVEDWPVSRGVQILKSALFAFDRLCCTNR